MSLFGLNLLELSFINHITQLFQSLTDAAADKLSNFKERSATGIQYVIEKHTSLEVNVSIQPNYVIIPHGGKYIE